MRIQVKIQGTEPLLMHSSRLADPLDSAAKLVAEISKKKNKQESDHKELSRREFMGGIYVDSDGTIILPNANIHAVIIKGAAAFKKGPAAKAGVFVDGHGTLDFPFAGKKTPEALLASGKFTDRRPVKNQGSSTVVRTRPKFEEWGSRFTLEIAEDICDQADVRQWLDNAGRRVGIGDYRPRFGRFKVVEFKPGEAKK